MKLNKLSTLALAVATAMASNAQADIEIGKGLTVSGFVDMSFNYIDRDPNAGSGATQGKSENTFNVDQVETQFKYSTGNGVSAQVDIEYAEAGGCDNGSSTCAPGTSGTDTTFVEQAFITKQINDQFSVTGGRFLSYSGWETEEPTGLFQYSGTGYAKYFYGGYQQGVSAKYVASDVATFTLNVVNDLATPTAGDNSQIGTEFGVHLTPAKGVTAKAFYLTDKDTDMLNVWASYSTDSLTFAAEYNTSENTGAALGVAGTAEADADGFLVMANYAAGDYGFTVRYHESEVEDSTGATVEELSAITLSPSYTVSDNLLIVAEYRMDSDDLNANADSDTFSLEALFTF